MRQLLPIILLLVLVLLCGALLATPVYELLRPYAEVSLHKLVPQLSSFAGLLVLCAWLKYRRLLDRATLGFARTATSALQQLLTGFFAGIMIMAVLAGALVVLGIHRLEADLAYIPAAGARIFLGALITGLLVGIFEETLYRGALLGGLLSGMKPLAAILFSSALYAAAHFLKFSEWPAGAAVTWTSGLQMLPAAFYRYGDPAILDAFLSLFAFGILLALVRLKTSAVYQCMGLHAGVVTAIKVINKTTDYVPGNSLAFMVNKYDHLLGYLALFWLAACILVYYKFAFSGQRQHN